jgi:hypothetical protein
VLSPNKRFKPFDSLSGTACRSPLTYTLERPFWNMGASQILTNEHVERSAATKLGYILFEYSRLDMELGFLLVWADNGQHLSVLTKKLNDLNFNGRLKLLEKMAGKKYQVVPAEALYTSWMTKAHSIRTMRNQFFSWPMGHDPSSAISCEFNWHTNIKRSKRNSLFY